MEEDKSAGRPDSGDGPAPKKVKKPNKSNASAATLNAEVKKPKKPKFKKSELSAVSKTSVATLNAEVPPSPSSPATPEEQRQEAEEPKQTIQEEKEEEQRQEAEEPKQTIQEEKEEDRAEASQQAPPSAAVEPPSSEEEEEPSDEERPASVQADATAAEDTDQEGALFDLDAKQAEHGSERSIASVLSEPLGAYAEVPPEELLEKAEQHLEKRCATIHKEDGTHEWRSVLKTHARSLGFLGRGVELYFVFLKMMGLLFLAMFMLSVPNMAWFAQGTMVQDPGAMADLAKLTVANVGRCPPRGCTSPEETKQRCLDEEKIPEECELKVRDVAEWIGTLDGLCVVLFMLFTLFLRERVIPHDRGCENYDTLGNYSVMVTHLPSYLDGEEATHYIWAVGLDSTLYKQMYRDMDEFTPWIKLPTRGLPSGLSSITVVKSWIFGVGADTRIYKIDYTNIGKPWKRVSKPGVSSINTYEGFLYAVMSDFCLCRQPFEAMTRKTEWVQASRAGVKAVGFHNGMAYGVDLENYIVQQHVDDMTTETEWKRYSPGDWKFVLSGEHVAHVLNKKPLDYNPTPMSITSIAIEGGIIYATGPDARIYEQRLTHLKADESAWRPCSTDKVRVKHLSILKERSHRNYKLNLGKHFRQILKTIEDENRDDGTLLPWKPRLPSAGRTASAFSSVRAFGGSRRARALLGFGSGHSVDGAGSMHNSGTTQATEAAQTERVSEADTRATSSSAPAPTMNEVAAGQKAVGVLKNKLEQRRSMQNRLGSIVDDASPDVVDELTKGKSRGKKLKDRKGSEVECWIVLNREGGEDLGVVLEDQPDALSVKSIIEGGLVFEWNAEHPDNNIHPGNRIVRVNSYMYCPKLMREELGQQRMLAVQIDKVVREVVIVRDYQCSIQAYFDRGMLMNQIKNLRLHLQKACEEGDDKSIRKISNELCKKCAEEEDLHRKLFTQGRLPDDCREVCTAFVTFQTQAARYKVLREYSLSRFRLLLHFLPDHLWFYGEPVSVREAPEPDNLKWENLDYPPSRQKARRTLGFISTIVLLFLCSLLIAAGKSSNLASGASQTTETTWIIQGFEDNGARCLRLCDWQLFGNPTCGTSTWTSATRPVVKIFDELNDYELQGSAASWWWSGNCSKSFWESPACAPGVNASSDWIGIQFADESAVGCMRVRQNLSQPVTKLRFFACPEPPTLGKRSTFKPSSTCLSMQSVQPQLYPEPPSSSAVSGNMVMLQDSSCAMTDAETLISAEVALKAKERSEDLLRDPTVDCFCMQQWYTNANFAMPPYDTPDKQMCKELLIEKGTATAKLMGGVLVVVVVNQILLSMFFRFVDAEKHPTDTGKAVSQFTKTFWAQFVNTGLLTYLVHARIQDILPSFVKLGKGTYVDQSPAWFISVGTSLFITVAVTPLTNTLPGVINSWVTRTVLFAWYRRKYLTPEMLNSVYQLPDWDLISRLAQTQNVICVIMMYSAGMPALYLVAMLYTFISYWVDKWMLLRGASKPPAYSEELILKASNLMYVGTILHTMFGLWTYSNQFVLPSGWNSWRGWAEWFLSIDLARYEEVMEKWRRADTEQEYADLYWDYVRARGLDLTRDATWFLGFIFAAYLLYFAASLLYRYVLFPIVGPGVAYIQHRIRTRLRHSSLMHEIETKLELWSCGLLDDPFGLHHADLSKKPRLSSAMESMTAIGMLTTYQLSENPGYHSAFLAISKLRKQLPKTCSEIRGKDARKYRHDAIARRWSTKFGERLAHLFWWEPKLT